MAEYEYELTEY